MQESWFGISAVVWTAVGTLGSVASFFGALAIAWIVQRASSRNSRELQRVIANLEDMARARRRDDLLAQLATSGDETHLKLLVDEGRVLTGERVVERVAIEVAYFTNPSAPLLTHGHHLPADLSLDECRAVMSAVVNALPRRFPPGSATPSRLAEEFGSLTRLAFELDANVCRIAELIVERSQDGWLVGDDQIRRLLLSLEGSGGYLEQAASDFLYRLMHVPPCGGLVNIVAGVSTAILDVRCNGRVLPTPRFHSVLTAFCMLMQRSLRGVGSSRHDEMMQSIATDHMIALMAHAVGACSGADDHLNLRAVEGLVRVLSSFRENCFTQYGTVATHLEEGVGLLLSRGHVGSLADELRGHTARLVGS